MKAPAATQLPGPQNSQAAFEIRHSTFCRGFSLLEALVANLLCLALFLCCTQLFLSLQSACSIQTESYQMQVAARLTRRALLLSVEQSGQNRTQDYLASSQPAELAIDSDLTGDSGDPDGALNHPFERQRFRMNPDFSDAATGQQFDRVGNLQWKSGQGSFQPFATRVVKLNFKVDQDAGSTRFVTASFQTRGRHFVGKRSNFPGRSFDLILPVEKNREQWFRYDLQK